MVRSVRALDVLWSAIPLKDAHLSGDSLQRFRDTLHMNSTRFVGVGP
jgi:hypothetical protein